jgi:protocatechuate 3,4-dioxygenase beta subunit
MTRRQLFAFCAAALALVKWPRWTYAQDREYERAVDAGFARFAGTTSAKARIAPPSEPGTPLRIRGTLYQPDGVTPLAGALVFAYHTDRAGLYNNDNAAHRWRLQGAARTGPDGRFEFETIRPASYPATRIPQHVHVALSTSEGRYHAGEWRFDDDPMLSAQERSASGRAGQFGWVCPVSVSDGQAEIAVNVKVKPESRF